jgi:hypothetical protein
LTKYLIDKITIEKTINKTTEATILVCFGDSGIGGSEVGGVAVVGSER